ncbi:hypothetical protein N7532_007637 [Penicillium argentinense]|uniref:Cell-cycle control medial ring component n=1 Tax=Penicillium argentinense TaxID=1131581 RepID=A0A9W9EVT4_9EURO|nr:uncharacterized protein N7532_007637 [Penicillium argentinense]KAJ5088953.1 hypothetical protein N7532_007637 [Penicillium argentinense]
MSELTFAKSFLSTLDSRPIKLRGDHVFDPERVGLRVPYTLPRLHAPHPEMPKKVKKTQAPGSSKSINIRIKSARNPVLDFIIANAPLSTTSVQDLRDAVRGRVADTQGNPVPLDKIKVLYHRKPVSGTSKTVAEVLADEPEMLAGGKEVEFGVMIIGGAKTVDAVESQTEGAQMRDVSPPKAAVGPSGREILQTDAFWNDLRGYLQQRLKDEEEANHLSMLFKNAWGSSQ